MKWSRCIPGDAKDQRIEERELEAGFQDTGLGAAERKLVGATNRALLTLFRSPVDVYAFGELWGCLGHVPKGHLAPALEALSWHRGQVPAGGNRGVSAFSSQPASAHSGTSPPR
jgi:hypothetical protein